LHLYFVSKSLLFGFNFHYFPRVKHFKNYGREKLSFLLSYGFNSYVFLAFMIKTHSFRQFFLCVKYKKWFSFRVLGKANVFSTSFQRYFPLSFVFLNVWCALGRIYFKHPFLKVIFFFSTSFGFFSQRELVFILHEFQISKKIFHVFCLKFSFKIFIFKTTFWALGGIFFLRVVVLFQEKMLALILGVIYGFRVIFQVNLPVFLLCLLTFV